MDRPYAWALANGGSGRQTGVETGLIDILGGWAMRTQFGQKIPFFKSILLHAFFSAIVLVDCGGTGEKYSKGLP